MIGIEHVLHRRRRGVEIVHGGRVENLVRERAVVRRAVTVPREDGHDFSPRILRVQEFGHLGRALPGPDHDEPVAHRRWQVRDPAEQVVVVPDPFGQLDAGWRRRLEPDGDDDAASPADDRLPGRPPHPDDVHHPDLAVDGDRPDVDHPRVVLDQVIQSAGGPFQVVVELLAQREHGLVVDEVNQAVPLMQERQITEIAGRIPQGYQVLEVGYLHRGPVEEHSPMPAESGLALQERHPQRRRRGNARVVLRHGDRQRQVRRAETDSDDVPNADVRGRRTSHHTRSSGPWARRPFPSVTRSVR